MKAPFAAIALGVLACLLPAPQANAADPDQLTIKAWMDGPSDLHIKKNGLYWTNGWAAKPGRQNRRNEPTYINGQPWVPHWGKQRDDRGPDKSTTFSKDIPSLDLDFKIVAIASTSYGSGIENRSSVTAYRKGFELIISIPDAENGARWYTFTLTPRKPKGR